MEFAFYFSAGVAVASTVGVVTNMFHPPRRHRILQIASLTTCPTKHFVFTLSKRLYHGFLVQGPKPDIGATLVWT